MLSKVYESHSVVSTVCDPMDYSVPGRLQARILECVAFPFSRKSSHPRDQTQVSHIAADSSSAEPPGKLKNTGVGSLSLLQRIFPTQGLNPGLPHGRQILYHLRHQEAHKSLLSVSKAKGCPWRLLKQLFVKKVTWL